jgi:hypothetical protein
MKLKAILLSAAMAATTATAAHAGAAWEFTSAGNSFSNGTWDFAAAFTVNANVTASGLGYYADPNTGNASGNPVALYECDNADCTGSGTLLATANIDNTYALNGHFRYQTITPVNLLAGHSYEVAGVSNQTNYTWSDAGFATDPAISLIVTNGQTDRWLAQGVPGFLNPGNQNLGGADGYWGPNVFLGAASGFTGTPEPAAWGLMIAGFGLMGVTLRRRRAVAASA